MVQNNQLLKEKKQQEILGFGVKKISQTHQNRKENKLCALANLRAENHS